MKKRRSSRTVKMKLPKAQKFGANMASVFTDKKSQKDLLGLFVGASLYALVPTLAGRFFKADTSGVKGVLWGLATGAVAAGFGGMGFPIFAGTVGAFAGHLWWTKLNGKVVYPSLGRYLWRWDPTAKDMGSQVAPNAFGDAMQSQMVRLPNGASIPIYPSRPRPMLPETERIAASAPRLNTSIAAMPRATVADYTAQMPSEQLVEGMLNDYTPDLVQPHQLGDALSGMGTYEDLM